MRLAMEASEPSEVGRLLSSATGDGEHLERLRDLWSAHPEFWRLAKSIQAAVDHGSGSGRSAGEHFRDIAASFDAAARISPEASVALYSLGDPILLEQATKEVVDYLADINVLGADRVALDIGCGSGRFEAALWARVRQIVGIDVSAEMIAAARARCQGLPNVDFRLTDGASAPEGPAASFDLILAVDSFPYIVQAGGPLAAIWLEGVARLLRPRGDLVILNYSYRDDVGLDRDDLLRLTQPLGLAPVTLAARPFRTWDGTAFHFRN
jgi:SAM-dependent methyltransferase